MIFSTVIFKRVGCSGNVYETPNECQASFSNVITMITMTENLSLAAHNVDVIII